MAAFPVLIRLVSAGFPFAEARGDGRDLRFGKPEGASLPFEIDVYDSAAHTAAIWVLADTVKGNSKGALMRMYWQSLGVIGFAWTAEIPATISRPGRPSTDNLFLSRVASSDSLRFSSFTGSAEISLTAGGAIAQNQ